MGRALETAKHMVCLITRTAARGSFQPGRTRRATEADYYARTIMTTIARTRWAHEGESTFRPAHGPMLVDRQDLFFRSARAF
jgi:hypothetical protein